MKRAVFLDRDGVLNRNVFYTHTGQWEAPLKPEDFVLVDGAMAALARLRGAGFLLFVVSNQPNFAKGKASMETLEAIHQRLAQSLADAGVVIEEFYYCFDHPEGVVPERTFECDCRKPSPYFLLKAANEYGLDLAQSWMVGDRDTDVECGRAAGTHTVRIVDELGNGSDRAEHHASDVGEAVSKILEHTRA